MLRPRPGGASTHARIGCSRPSTAWRPRPAGPPQANQEPSPRQHGHPSAATGRTDHQVCRGRSTADHHVVRSRLDLTNVQVLGEPDPIRCTGAGKAIGISATRWWVASTTCSGRCTRPRSSTTVAFSLWSGSTLRAAACSTMPASPARSTGPSTNVANRAMVDSFAPSVRRPSRGSAATPRTRARPARLRPGLPRPSACP